MPFEKPFTDISKCVHENAYYRIDSIIDINPTTSSMSVVVGVYHDKASAELPGSQPYFRQYYPVVASQFDTIIAQKSATKSIVQLMTTSLYDILAQHQDFIGAKVVA